MSLRNGVNVCECVSVCSGAQGHGYTLEKSTSIRATFPVLKNVSGDLVGYTDMSEERERQIGYTQSRPTSPVCECRVLF